MSARPSHSRADHPRWAPTQQMGFPDDLVEALAVAKVHKPDVTDVASRLKTPWKPRAVMLGLYLVAVLSKRWTMPLVPNELFWSVDMAYFVALPLVLYLVGWRLLGSANDPADDADRMAANDDLNGFNTITLGVWLFLFLLLVWYVVGRFYPAGNMPGWLMVTGTFSYAEHLPKVDLYRWVWIVYMATTAAIVEEFFFRKAVWQVQQNWTRSAFLYVPLSALLFGLAHWAQGDKAIVQAFAAGLLLALCYVKVRRLAPLVIAHFLLDLAAFS